MIDPRKYIAGPDAEISDIDLDVEEVHLPDGRRLTEELADQLEAAEAEKTRARQTANLIPGRKSLSRDGRHSPVVQVRLPSDVYDLLQQAAAERQVTASQIARTAIERFLA